MPGIALFGWWDRIVGGLGSRWRNLAFRARGVRIRGYCWLRRVEIPRNHDQILLDECSLDRGVVLIASGTGGGEPTISIGRGTYVNRYTILDAIESLVIGNEVAIGPNCYITDHDHGMDPARAPLQQPMVAQPTRIEDRAWVGANVVVLKGVTIGQGSIVGAGSVVTRSVPPRAVAVGSPARVIRMRDNYSSAKAPTEKV